MQPNELADLRHVESFGAAFHTDKIEPHKYFTTYLKIAADLGPRASVCEVGVWQGESLRMWQALFPLGRVTGVDYQAQGRVWPEKTIQVIAGQDDPRLPSLLEEAGAVSFDLIVDDASHRGTETARSFEMLWPLVPSGGYYVIEDWNMALERPDEVFLSSVTDLTRLLGSRDAECDWVHYQWGLAIAHKAGAAL
jgi:hypothetical protein